MKSGDIKLGRLEAQFFAYTQFKRKTLVRLGEIAPALDITAKQERELLSRLARNQWISRIWRGLYAVPERLPPGGIWSPGAYRALDMLMRELNGRYQITGATAFNFHGFDDQVPNWIIAYNNRLSGRREIGGGNYLFIKTPDNRLGGICALRAPDGVRVVYSSKARTLMDAVYDWSRFNGIPRAYRWIETAVKKDPALADELARVTRRYGNQGTLRRIGFVLARAQPGGAVARTVLRAISKGKSLIPLIPTRPVRGRGDTTWGIIVNE
jgi:predicted transcriptional regulator of viral defense system